MTINKSELKTYAIQARIDFIQAVKDKAAKFGIFDDHTVPAKEQGDMLIIDRMTYPRSIAGAYNNVLKKIRMYGYEEAMNEIAYTWFNRMVALRYMELHNLFNHGYKVIGDERPEILIHANDVVLDGLNMQKVTDLLLAGNRDEELYAYLLQTQFAALNKAMPFLFEKIDDATALLMPGNLLASDSVRAKMLALDPANFDEIEVVGWLYQFYISEQKDKLMEAGKAYKKEEIPAVTQLFTPNWIVKYMIQNSLGSKWLETYPNSPLKSKMEYYIEPAKQDPEVQKELDKIKDERINPEELKVLDPACGSGHILVEAYDLLKEIYTERGYNRRDIPELIITKNLYGIDIDKRAAQLASFAVAMKAVKDNTRLLDKEIKLNIIDIEETNSLNIEPIANTLIESRKVNDKSAVMQLLETFTDAKTYGSLIKIDHELMEKLPTLRAQVDEVFLSGNIFEKKAAEEVKPFIKMAEFLGQKYDIVVANPPYMGDGKFNQMLKSFAQNNYPMTKSDLCTMFMEQALYLLKSNAIFAMINQQAWMFLSSFEKMRQKLIDGKTITTMAHMGFGAFGADFGTTAFTVRNCRISFYKGTYISLREARSLSNKQSLFLQKENRFTLNSLDFSKIPGSPIAYWASCKSRDVYKNKKMDEVAQPRHGLATSDNERFLKLWHEVNIQKSSIIIRNDKNKKWFPMNKGGNYRKWYGNLEWVINYENDGKELKDYAISLYKCSSRTIQNTQFYFKEGLTWSALSSGDFSVRWSEKGALFGSGGYSAFADQEILKYILGLLNSKVTGSLIEFVSPTLNYEVGHIKTIPVVVRNEQTQVIDELIKNIIHISKSDWNSFETSWDFEKLPILKDEFKKNTVRASYNAWRTQSLADIVETKQLEEENNELFIKAYGLQDELTPDVPIEQITLKVNPRYRYKSNAPDAELEERFESDSIKELVSYAIGCMMGRYSLDKQGLIYANEKGEGFNPADYKTYPADGDGIIPVTDTAWFPAEDVVERLVAFVKTVWGNDTLAENLDFIANALDKKPTETSLEAIRRYMTKDFYKDHMQTYKNRPIYWLFSSGKEKAFECLVYMHRMNAQTLARIRMEFIVPLMSKFEATLAKLEQDLPLAESTASRKIIEKQIDKLTKQKHELVNYDDVINHAINERIEMDLDDGVKVNYAKFANLLAESKKIVGK